MKAPSNGPCLKFREILHTLPSMLLVIPAIEIKDGRCVQMVQGVEGFAYSDDPVEMARLWRKENARTLHVTDVDGALQGHLVNVESIRQIVEAVDIPIEVGGGLRTFADVQQAFDLGVYRVVVGTMLIESPEEARRVIEVFGSSKVVLGIDAYDGIVATRGWRESSGLTALTVAMNAREIGFRRMIYTDIRMNGTLRGVNLRVLRELAEKSGLRITSSGGSCRAGGSSRASRNLKGWALIRWWWAGRSIRTASRARASGDSVKQATILIRQRSDDESRPDCSGKHQ